MTVSVLKRASPTLGLGSTVLAAAAGAVSLFGTYWDDAWHTDRGRDTAWAPPHLALYGGVAVVGLVILAWAARTLVATRSVHQTLGHRPLILAGVAGAVILGTAPADAWWHTAFGRDAVLWSPPHILVLFASITLVVGLLAGVDARVPPLWRAGVGAILVGDLLVAVMEYDTDVPQFSAWWYLPVLLAGALLAAELLRGLSPRVRLPVTTAVLIYVGLRLATMALLAALGHSIPDLPIAVLGLCVSDLPWRRPLSRVAATAAAVSALAWLTAVVGASSVAAGPVGVLGAVAMAGWALTALRHRARRPAAAALLLSAALAASLGLDVRPADAHDPGQGEILQSVQAVAASDGRGGFTLAVRLGQDCDQFRAVAVVGRRGGESRSAPLTADGPCRFSGSLQVPAGGRWFLYAQLDQQGAHAETWVPIISDQATQISERRLLYRPADRARARAGKYVAGTGLYLVGLLLLGSATVFVWRNNRRSTPPA